MMLRAEQLSFTYARGLPPIVEEWSADFPAGTTTALTGPSGRGKSTLLYLLGLMLEPRSGEIYLSDVPVSRVGDAGRSSLRAHRFGFVFQDAALDPTRTVMDNITETALYRGTDRKAAIVRARELLSQFGVDVAADRKPGQVSGGQAQRIALCRALLNSPDVLLADEPTGNLDPDTAEIVIEALRTHADSGAAVIVVTHSPDLAAVCDHRIEL